jgi:hypothetical protein
MEQIRWLREEARDTGCLGITPNNHKTAESIENQTAVGATLAPALSEESRRQPFKDEFNESLANGVARKDLFHRESYTRWRSRAKRPRMDAARRATTGAIIMQARGIRPDMIARARTR